MTARNYKKKVLQFSGGIQFAAIETANSNSCPQIIGYARVSTDDQILDVQMSALRAAGCDHIFKETISAVNAKRPEFGVMMKHLEPGDTLIVHSLSRLGRDSSQVSGILKELAALGVTWRSLTEPHLETATASGRQQCSRNSVSRQWKASTTTPSRDIRAKRRWIKPFRNILMTRAASFALSPQAARKILFRSFASTALPSTRSKNRDI